MLILRRSSPERIAPLRRSSVLCSVRVSALSSNRRACRTTFSAFVRFSAMLPSLRSPGLGR